MSIVAQPPVTLTTATQRSANHSAVGAPVTTGVAPGRGHRLSGQPAHRLELCVQPGEDHVVVQIWGELYTSRLNELTRVLDTQVRAGRTRVLLDISRLYDLDADAISILSRWQTALAAMGGCLWLAAPRPWVRRLLEHMCLRGTFKVFPTLLDAISALTGASASPV